MVVTLSADHECRFRTWWVTPQQQDVQRVGAV